MQWPSKPNVCVIGNITKSDTKQYAEEIGMVAVFPKDTNRLKTCPTSDELIKTCAFYRGNSGFILMLIQRVVRHIYVL